jgi:hypothetical protein
VGTLFDENAEIVRQVGSAIASVLGPPHTATTKKVAKWVSPTGLTVNLHRESRRTATIWFAGPTIAHGGEVLLANELTLVPGDAPRNSNCSPAIKQGPTAFAYAQHHSEVAALTELLTTLNKGEYMTDIATTADDDLDQSDDDAALELATPERQILTQALDERVEGLVSRIKRGRLILQPDFQRDFVWSKSKASLLIESILMRIPMPVVYVAEIETGAWEVVDGQQRLTAIKSYLDGHFPDGEPFKLGQLRVRADLRGKAFKDLTADDQAAIEDYTLRIIKIMKEADPDLKFEVFERLNSGADKLNDMELRNCVYRGSYNDLLKELAGHDLMLKVRRADAPDTRMQDRQMILRFFSMWRNTHLRYRAPMKQFMNHEMQNHRHVDVAKIAEMRRVFLDAMQCAWDVFGDRAFRRFSVDATQPRGSWDIAGKLNLALWDTVLYVFTYFERRQIVPVADAIYEEFLDVMTNDATFVDFIGRTTDKPDRVRFRAETWKKRIEDLVKVPAGETRNFSRQLKVSLHEANPACTICNQTIHHVDDAELDHVEHYWRGGRTIPENARLTHRYCNRVRGGRMDMDASRD